MWVVKLYRTDSMEAAMRHMAETNRNVIVYWRHKTIKPIRMRLNLTRDILCEVAMSWMPMAQAAVDRWAQRGGVLIWKPHPLAHRAPVPACDAMLFIECPMQIDQFNHITKDVKQEVVVYRPPTWELHNESVEQYWPGKNTYSTLDAIAGALVGRELTEEMEGVLRACGYPAASTAAFTAWDIEQLTGWNERHLKLVMHYKYKFNYGRWHLYSLRFPPDDPELLWAYNIIRQQPEVSRKVHTLRLARPAGSYVHGFKTMLKRLEKENYVVREDSIYVLNTAHRPLDYDRIDAITNMHRGRWFAMKALVDGAQEYLLD